MEVSFKTIGMMIEPIVAVFFPFVLFGVDLNGFFLATTLSVEERVRVWMAVMFAIYYLLKIVRFYEEKGEVERLRVRVEVLERELMFLKNKLGE